jgi:hypothetical protein
MTGHGLVTIRQKTVHEEIIGNRLWCCLWIVGTMNITSTSLITFCVSHLSQLYPTTRTAVWSYERRHLWWWWCVCDSLTVVCWWWYGGTTLPYLFFVGETAVFESTPFLGGL